MTTFYSVIYKCNDKSYDFSRIKYFNKKEDAVNVVKEYCNMNNKNSNYITMKQTNDIDNDERDYLHIILKYNIFYMNANFPMFTFAIQCLEMK